MSPKESVQKEVLRVLKMEGQAILACADRLQSPASAPKLQEIVELLSRAIDQGGKIVLTGVGKSGKICEKIAATLCGTGSLAVFLHPTEGLHGDLGIVTAKDVVIAISQSGNTDELIRLIPALKKRGTPVIAMSGSQTSKLVQLSNFWLDTAIEQEACPHNLAPTTSTTLALALGDALAMALMQLRGFDATAFAGNHPGGSLGRRLHLTVNEVMHSGDSLPRVAPSAGMEEVIHISTQKKLGAVAVMESSGKLSGLVTDGDLRRALAHREKFFNFQAQEIMTTKPTTVRPEQMASEALELMENRPSQISVLPVVDAQGKCVGLVRLHDLLQSL